ncbi:MAG: beta-ketoacyl synthase N-terminal-like domain-containing protein [Peptococcaceae bacterium]|jgi:polyketide synthase PksN|nr:phosphopantetheine-binding protein [Peptococcaceae bacterium]MDH7526009.1 beta-ketoacyl synthase N-terminal-like domain-containing protein [Peptococcaceae bacterium]
MNGQMAEERIRTVIRECVAQELKMAASQVQDEISFSEFGVDSIIAVNLVNLLNHKLGFKLRTTVFFDYSSVNKLARHIIEENKPVLTNSLQEAAPAAEETVLDADSDFKPAAGIWKKNRFQARDAVFSTGVQKEAIAVIGMSGRFAKSKTLSELWEHLASGDDLVEEVTRWNLAEYFPGEKYCNYGSFLDDIDLFDPLFFNISGLEAAYMDPRQRIFLEECWKALEDAGYAGEGLKGRSCGVYAGCGAGDYHLLLGENPPAQAVWGNDSAVIPGRVSYYLDIHGPAVSVDTACSSSLVAVHLACQGLWTKEIDLALAGGVYLNCTPGLYIPGNKAGMLSPSGRCYTFDERADGFVPGEGAGVVVLKRLAEAAADGDYIYGIIRGTGINQDGATNGITAPSALSQERLECYVYDNFNINPENIQVVEAHGTGTKLGDPIEYQALTRAFRKYTNKKEYCAIGSIKSNLGHTTYAAGVAGLIKVLLSLKHKQIPPSLHFRSGNANIRFKDSPFYVNTVLREWKTADGSGRMAAVSSFGLSGTNAHLVVEEAPARKQQYSERSGYLVVLSARTAGQLKEQAKQLVEYCGREPRADCGDISFTLLLGRRHLDHRLACIARSRAELAGKLRRWLEEGRAPQVYHSVLEENNRREHPSLKQYGNQCIARCRPGGGENEYLEHLSVVAELYVQGYELEIEKLFAGDRYGRIPLPTYPFARERYWVDEPSSRFRPLGINPVISKGGQEPACGREETLPEDLEARGRQWKEIESELCRLLWHQLQAMGLFKEKHFAAADIKAKAGIRGLYDRWLEESLAVLARNEYLRCDGASYSLIDGLPAGTDKAWEEWERKKGVWLEDPGLKAPVSLAEATLRSLPEILTGKVLATEVIFPGSSMELVEGIYKNNAVADYFNGVAAGKVAACLRERLKQDPGARLSILEIGAGTGGTSKTVLAQIRPFREHVREYCYTDISKAFLMYAEKEYGPQNPYLTYRIFNVELPPAEQGIGAGEYDIVIAANVLHATKNIRRTLRNTREVLKEGGLLVLNEISGGSVFSHLTFGLLEGWWLYEDTLLRIPGSPALSSQTWQAVLEEEGFSQVVFPAKKAHELGQQVIVARKGKEVKPLQAGGPAQDLLRERSKSYFQRMIGDLLKIPFEKIEPSAPLIQYGLDSILIGQLTARLRETFDDLSGALLFEHQTIDDLVDYFLSAQKESLVSLLEGENPEAGGEKFSAGGEVVVKPPPAHQPGPYGEAGVSLRALNSRDIAVIGLAGRYPGARNVREFWKNLCEGKDCITEIPPDRWDHSLYFDPDKNKAGKTCCKWGGFIEGVDRFDPLFFNLSPHEAENTDPQERLFLETVWELMESAGYTRKSLQQLYQGRVGVYVGAVYQQYHNASLFSVPGPFLATSSCSYIANRVSRFFDFQGPSLSVDTACSSSATAVHLACEGLRRGECRLAVAGGVNLILNPLKYLVLSKAQLLGSHSGSRSFGGGDGFLPAEGAGAVLLKPLDQAEHDGDPILAVLKTTMINNGGNSGGYNIPNLNAQARLIEENLGQAGIDPRSISYVEAAAMGSAVGDVIEVAALSRAFQKHTTDRQFCAIGSVKSNIGHAETASGISQLTKVVLQLQHRQLVPSIKADPLNPGLNLANTPFYLQRELQEWKRPVVKIRGKEQEFPRRATVSSFGGGGSNVHLVVEEYIPEQAEDYPVGFTASPQVAVFSAKSEERLREAARQMLGYLEEEEKGLSLSDLAYALQAGREEMECRLAVVAADLEQLAAGLRMYLESREKGEGIAPVPPVFTGSLKEGRQATESLFSGKTGEALIKELLDEKDLSKIALYWAKGGEIPWESLQEGHKARRISLPTYPFERMRCWNGPWKSETGRPERNEKGGWGLLKMLAALWKKRKEKRESDE